MSIIKVLPVDVRNKISAGEVVERPASVVKELVENSIDAGSTDIRVEILNGGKRMIKVSDNGMGMGREDALLCFERHATSKLSTADDLFDITTLGFRGEALPSIASVSKVNLTTGLKGSHSGVSIDMTGGEVLEVKDAPVSGTAVEVRDLFFNTPARKKFLKTNNTELFHILDTVTKEALSHTDIGFTLLSDTKEALLVPAASGYRERIMQVYGESFLKGLMEGTASSSGMGLTAFTSVTGSFRNSRDHQFIFINSRPVKDQSISHAVYKAYEGILPSDRHPVFFIYLSIDPARVDFNVHPTKREVRFEDRESVYRFIIKALKGRVKGDRDEYAKAFSVPAEACHPAGPFASYTPSEAQGGTFVSENPGLSYTPSLPYIYLGDTFIAVSGKGGLTLVDHHAAHERVLYERLLGRVNITSHQMLFPEQVRLSHKEYLVILGNRDVIAELGIEVEDFGHDTVIVRSAPDELQGADLRGILTDVASSVSDGLPPEKSLKEALAARLACHSSVRGREILNRDEVARLLSDLEKTEMPDQCPHGRPTRIFMSSDDLKKLFKRK
ncbi:MAG: DNA mismatch repair endonuclease MutL [Nitrospirae bacterium]|nr:DNA mismatch repair endonuclease MutL [Nitrospirota bacterium]